MLRQDRESERPRPADLAAIRRDQPALVLDNTMTVTRGYHVAQCALLDTIPAPRSSATRPAMRSDWTDEAGVASRRHAGAGEGDDLVRDAFGRVVHDERLGVWHLDDLSVAQQACQSPRVAQSEEAIV